MSARRRRQNRRLAAPFTGIDPIEHNRRIAWLKAYRARERAREAAVAASVQRGIANMNRLAESFAQFGMTAKATADIIAGLYRAAEYKYDTETIEGMSKL